MIHFIPSTESTGDHFNEPSLVGAIPIGRYGWFQGFLCIVRGDQPFWERPFRGRRIGGQRRDNAVSGLAQEHRHQGGRRRGRGRRRRLRNYRPPSASEPEGAVRSAQRDTIVASD